MPEKVTKNILEGNKLENTLLQRFADQDSQYKEKIQDLINETREKLIMMVAKEIALKVELVEAELWKNNPDQTKMYTTVPNNQEAVISALENLDKPQPAPAAEAEAEPAPAEPAEDPAEGGGKRKRSRSSKKQNRRNSKKSRKSNKKVVNSKKNNNNNKNNNKKNNNNNNKKNNSKKNNNRNNNSNKSKKSKKNNKRK